MDWQISCEVIQFSNTEEELKQEKQRMKHDLKRVHGCALVELKLAQA
jgi:hypothetical protein